MVITLKLGLIRGLGGRFGGIVRPLVVIQCVSVNMRTMTKGHVCHIFSTKGCQTSLTLDRAAGLKFINWLLLMPPSSKSAVRPHTYYDLNNTSETA